MSKKDRATTANSDYTELYAVVGELVMIANAVDHLLNQLVIEALHLEKSPMLESVCRHARPAAEDRNAESPGETHQQR